MTPIRWKTVANVAFVAIGLLMVFFGGSHFPVRELGYFCVGFGVVMLYRQYAKSGSSDA